MKYKYSRDQIFGKRLKVPKEILKLVYENYLSFSDFIKYDLVDKIPLSCVRREHRKIVEHFGLENAKQLDWEFLEKAPSYYNHNFYETILKISPEDKDINSAIYEALKNVTKPEDYSPRMKERYKDRYIDLAEITDENIKKLAERFNRGECTLEEIVKYWDFFKNKNIELCLINDRQSLSHQDISRFIESFGEFTDLLIKTRDLAHCIYTYKEKSQEEMYSYLNYIINNYRLQQAHSGTVWGIEDDGVLLYQIARRFFEKSSVYKFLAETLKSEEIINKKTDEYLTVESDDYLAVPGSLKRDRIQNFLDLYGVENVIQFDRENNNFFSRNNCEMLDKVNDECLDNGTTLITILGKNSGSYSIDEFYEIMKKILLYTHTYDLRDLNGEFKNKFPELYINESAPRDLQEKFYNRRLTLQDLMSKPDLFDYFNSTNIIYGSAENVSWLAPILDEYNGSKTAKENIIEVMTRLILSNSSEISTFRKELAVQILTTTNPIEILDKIEDVFIRNNIPTVGKIYSCFEILHPDFEGFNFDDPTISPVLKKSSLMGKKIVIFSDLIKASFGSNNRSVNTYLRNIEIAYKLYESLRLGQIKYCALNEEQKKELTIFSRHLETLYNNTLKAKKTNATFTATGNVLMDILELSKRLSPNGTLNYNLADRVIKMFCGYAGIDTLERAKSYVNRKVNDADSRNREAAKKDMTLEQGDFIKGIKDIGYLKSILQNGCVSKEFLGSDAESDKTPLDTDLSMITSSEGTIQDKFSATAAIDYGPIWLVLKNDDRFITTRTDRQTFDVRNDISKIEVFYTGVMGSGHYGIRTGFASSEINYIVMDNYDPRVGLEIAMNGFYIPVTNKEGKIVFTPNDYDRLREKMSGLSYYGENGYIFSENLITEETKHLVSQIEQNAFEIQVKKSKIYEIIKKSLVELGLNLKTFIDGDLSEGYVELIDTGSTGRGTNKPGDGDFDFIVRLDKKIIGDFYKKAELKENLLRNLGKPNSIVTTFEGDFRAKGFKLDRDVVVDIDMTFIQKTDKTSYSTDMALQDRLATIQKIDPEKYKYVVANIILAKQVLKQAEIYKPRRGDLPQGGLGGVGIENWVLQNGGSFIDAAISFIESSEGRSFEEFKANYQIWDFGSNHLAERRGQYSHDNFITDNMSESGYRKMVQVLKEYVKNHIYYQKKEKK